MLVWSTGQVSIRRLLLSEYYAGEGKFSVKFGAAQCIGVPGAVGVYQAPSRVITWGRWNSRSDIFTFYTAGAYQFKAGKLCSLRSTVSDHIRNIQSIHFTTLENIDELNMRHKPLFHQKHNKIFVNVNQLNFMLHKPFR